MAGKWEFAYSADGTNAVPAVNEFPVAASQTLVPGDAVSIVSGQVTKGGNGFGRCLGVMAQTSTSAAAGTKVRVAVARPEFVWRATATADATAHVMAARTYDLDASLNINVADTTGGCIEIVKLGASTTAVYASFVACEFA